MSTINKQVITTVIKDSYSETADVMYEQNLISKYNRAFTDITFKPEKFDDIVELIKNETSIIPLVLPTKDEKLTQMVEFVNDEIKLVVTLWNAGQNASVDMYFQNLEDSLDLYTKIFNESSVEDDGSIITLINLGYNAQRQLEKQISLKTASEFEKTDNDYYPYIDTDLLFDQFNASDSDILVCTGEPGVGKTKIVNSYIKKACKETSDEDINVLIVKNEDILADDAFWAMVRDEDVNMVVLDDLDYGLLPRTQDISSNEDVRKNQFISNLLSFTDGIDKGMRKPIKWIITTNREVKDIDSAIMRRGRTFDVLKLRKLTKEEGLVIWKKHLAEEDYTQFATSEHILQADLGSEIQLRLTISDKSKLNSYLKEPGISLMNTFIGSEIKLGL